MIPLEDLRQRERIGFEPADALPADKFTTALGAERA